MTYRGPFLLGTAVVLFWAGCGGKVEPAPASMCPTGGGGLELDVDGVLVTVRSATAVVDQEESHLFGVALSESADACREFLSRAPSNDQFPLLFAGGAVGDLRAPNELPIEPLLIPRQGTAKLILEPDCLRRTTQQVATSGTFSITSYEPGKRIQGRFDAVLPSGKHLIATFDTCFCSAAVPCSTPL